MSDKKGVTKGMKKGKRVISAVLAAILCVSSVPILRSANAAELAGTEDTASPSGENTEEPAGTEDTDSPSGGNTEEDASPDAENQNSEDTGSQSSAEGDAAASGDPTEGDAVNSSDPTAEDAAASSDPTAGDTEEPANTEDIRYNLGDFEYRMTDLASLEQMYEEAEDRSGNGDDSMQIELLHYQAYGEDSNYTIELEQNAYFPYEVQFTENGTVTEAWFMTSDDTVTVGGHVFSVHSQTDGTAVTQMSLKIAGDTVTVYPEKKTFTNDGQGPASGISLLPLKEERFEVNLSNYTPIELTMVSVDEIFTGKIALDAKKVMWTRAWDDHYTISQKGDQLNLFGDYGTSDSWEMIVGETDQLEKSNTRYTVTVQYDKSISEWLTSVCYIQNEAGERVQGQTSSIRYDYSESSDVKTNLYLYTASDSVLTTGNAGNNRYISIQDKKDLCSDRVYTLRAFEGVYDPASGGSSGTEITDKLFASDMNKKDAGYLADLYAYPGDTITLVSYDVQNNVTGCLPLILDIRNGDGQIGRYSLEDEEGNYVGESNGLYYKAPNYRCDKIKLYKGYSKNSSYVYQLRYDRLGEEKNSAIVAAYAGNYDSIEEAKAANAVDIKDRLFGESGYLTNKPLFSIFLGADGKVLYKYEAELEESTEPKDSYLSSSSTYIHFRGLSDSEGKSLTNVRVCNSDLEDSYAEGSYITILTKASNLDSLALVFDEYSNVLLYSEDGNRVESGKTCFNFSKGPVQFTAASEDKSYQKNYWVQVINPDDSTGAQQLYVNSLKNPEAHTQEKDGAVYSTREVVLDSYYDNEHDILLVNRGTAPIAKLSVELQSDVVELDKYWTLTGNNALDGFTEESIYELSNLAKIRIRAKDGVEAGTAVEGTLTIKSGETTLMVLTLTGTVGDPAITTKEVPKAVKYVPYGTMIQNNNKYSWNTVSYELISGKLPNGVELKRNGELYGVPKEFGEFKFEVRMNNSYYRFRASTKEFTFTVLDNTDENVEQATDANYTLSQRIGDIDVSSTGNYLVVSEGVFTEFQDIYLDGEKLVKGTDYTAESGSTRITITAQTLKKDGTQGSHTIGIEFRNSDDEVKKAAQNYKVTKQTPSYNESINNTNSGGNSSSGSNSSNNNNNNGGGSNSGGNNNSNGGGNNNVTEEIENSDSESAPDTIADIITKAKRAAAVKRPKNAVFTTLFDKRTVKKGAADLLEVIERLFRLNTAGSL